MVVPACEAIAPAGVRAQGKWQGSGRIPPWMGTTAGDWSRNSSYSLARRWFMRISERPSPAMKRIRELGYFSRMTRIS